MPSHSTFNIQQSAFSIQDSTISISHSSGRTSMRTPSALLLLALCGACARPAAQTSYDLVVAGGSVLNGEGTPAVMADIGIRDGRIAAIGDLRAAPSRQHIDANGLTVAPGFIDMHNHSD